MAEIRNNVTVVFDQQHRSGLCGTGNFMSKDQAVIEMNYTGKVGWGSKYQNDTEFFTFSRKQTDYCRKSDNNQMLWFNL